MGEKGLKSGSCIVVKLGIIELSHVAYKLCLLAVNCSWVRKSSECSKTRDELSS